MGRIIVRSIIVFLSAILLVALAAGLWLRSRLPPPPRPNHNALLLGDAASAERVTIAIQPPAELDFLPRDEVLAQRRSAVEAYPALLGGAYEPDDRVFAQIVDGLPWWGLVGQWQGERGEGSIVGLSEESRFLLNPYLLVAADLYYFQGMTERGAWNWSHQQVSQERVEAPDFPTACDATQVMLDPRARAGEALYSISDCTAAIASAADEASLRFYSFQFNLIAYNARDFNLNYVYVDYDGAENIVNYEQPDYAYLNPQFIHEGGSCGYPGNCNNMSPATPEIDEFELVALPARLPVKLWRDAPARVEDPADLVFTLRFE